MPKFFVRRCLASLWFLPLLTMDCATAQGDRADEVRLTPDSVNYSPGWALEQVGENYPDGAYYTYPDTSNPVRLYLIDTAVANPASFVAANPKLKLTFEGTVLVRGNGDPTTSTPRDHGTQLLSLIAGMDTGIAPGTPIHVMNYDIYPSPTTTKALLADAIGRAVEHSINPNTQKMRSVILIATSSLDPTSSYSLLDSINYALSEGIPVVVSAGNLNRNASNYVPCSYGTMEGVICVGASTNSDALWNVDANMGSNFGSPVDLLAPGNVVWTHSQSATSPIIDMSGTSPAAALVAGSVLAELSINGSLTPAQVESKLKVSAKPLVGLPPVLRHTAAATISINNPDGPVIPIANPIPLTATASPSRAQSISTNSIGEVCISPSQDLDSDGISDVVEIFHQGTSNGTPASPILSLGANQEIQFKFPIAFDFFNNSNPFELGNGYTWGIRCTSNFKTWKVPTGSMTKSTDSKGQVWLTATFPEGHPSCFVQIEIHPPGS